MSARKQRGPGSRDSAPLELSVRLFGEKAELAALEQELTELELELATIQGTLANFNATYLNHLGGRFVLEGVDDLGLVHKVTSLLAKYHLSIDTMETSDEIAPHGGTTLFRIDGIATGPNPLPKSFEPDGIREELGALGDSLNVDITLKDNITRRRVGWRS